MIVAARFAGPPGTANGGYAAGAFAGSVPAEVTLRRPVPVDTELTVAGGRVLTPDGTLVAEVVPGPADTASIARHGDALPAVSVEEARAAAARTPLAEGHPFPACFGCGPDHPTGLHCLAGPVGRDGLWAVAFTPPDATPPIVWAALDCPSAAPHMAGAPGVPHVLGRIAAVQVGPITPGEPHLVVALGTGARDRRRFSVSAIRDAGGRTVAVARTTWFVLGGV